MKILVTGAIGFIGTHLSKELIDQGHEVIGIDIIEGNDFHPLRKFNFSFIPDTDNFKFFDLNILNQELLEKVIKQEQPDYIIHTAAKAGVRTSIKYPLLYTKTNVLGSQNILDAVRKYSPETKLILFSTSSVYGIQDNAPFEETMEPNPLSPYSITKYIMERIARQYNRFYHLPIIIVRPFSIYGPLGRLDMAPFLIIKAAEMGNTFTQFGHSEDNKRDWTYVKDFVQGIMGIVKKHDFKKFDIVNLGNNTPVGIDEFVNTMKDLCKKYLDKDLNVEYGERGKEELPLTYAKIQKAKKLFEYNPKTDFEKGMEELFRFYKKNRKLYLKHFKDE